MVEKLRIAAQVALEAWQDAARAWHALKHSPYDSTRPADGTNVLTAQGVMRNKAAVWADADAELRAAIEQESKAA